MEQNWLNLCLIKSGCYSFRHPRKQPHFPSKGLNPWAILPGTTGQVARLIRGRNETVGEIPLLGLCSIETKMVQREVIACPVEARWPGKTLSCAVGAKITMWENDQIGEGHETPGDKRKGLDRGRAQHKSRKSQKRVWLVWKKAYSFPNSRIYNQSLPKALGFVHSFIRSPVH